MRCSMTPVIVGHAEQQQGVNLRERANHFHEWTSHNRQIAINHSCYCRCAGTKTIFTTGKKSQAVIGEQLLLQMHWHKGKPPT
jgi:hypothetical protein